MGNFNKFGGDRGGRGFGGGGFGGGRKFGGHGGAPRQMFQAICSKCGQDCEVPFKPTGDRPVFCNNCFKTESSTSPRFSASKSFGGGNFAPKVGGGISKEQFDMLNVKLDKILAALAPAKSGKVEEKIKPVEKVKPIAVEEKPAKVEVKKAKAPAKKAKAKKK